MTSTERDLPLAQLIDTSNYSFRQIEFQPLAEHHRKFLQGDVFLKLATRAQGFNLSVGRVPRPGMTTPPG